jgi:hypothetical protein
MREDKCAGCQEIIREMGGYDPDQGWLCSDCWGEPSPSGTLKPSGIQWAAWAGLMDKKIHPKEGN